MTSCLGKGRAAALCLVATFVVVLAVPGSSPAEARSSLYDSTYYAPAAGLSGPALESALHGIIDDQTKLSYSQVWTALQDTDEDPADPTCGPPTCRSTARAATRTSTAVGRRSPAAAAA